LVLRGHAPEHPELRKEWLEEQWDLAIDAQAAALAAAWPGRQVPAPKRWRGYVATRTRLLRRLEKFESPTAVAAESASVSRAGRPPLPWVERKVVDEEIGLYGTPDLVEERAGRLRVVDLKSGVHQSVVKENQRRQLLLYAHLVGKALDRLVHEVAIIDVRGQEAVIVVLPGIVQEAVATAVSALQEFNEFVHGGSTPARPGCETCRFCPFKIVCRPYWQARQADWGTDIVVGTVTDMPLPNVATVSEGENTVRVVLTNGERFKIGDDVVLAGLDPAGPGTYRLRWDSQVRIA
jgi:CRISPR/Cas system-associated exonuclease Cas4 (RecB family)